MDAVCAAVALLNRKKKLRNEAKEKRNGHKTSTDTNVTPSEGTSNNTTSSDAPRFYFHNWIVNGHTTHANSPAPQNDNSNGTLNQDRAQGDDGKQKYSNGTKEADSTDKTSSFSFLQFFRDRVWFKSSDKPTESPDDAGVNSDSNAKITDECIKQEAAKRFTDFYIDSYEECFILADADMPVSMLIAMSSCNRKKSNDTKPVDSKSPATKLEEFKPNDQRDAKLHETKPEPENSKLHDTNPNDTKLNGTRPSEPLGDKTNDSKLNDTRPNATKAMSDKPHDSELNGTGPKATKAMSDKPTDSELNGTGPKATKAMSDKTNDSMLNDTGTKAYHLKLESDMLKKSKPNDKPNKPTKSNDKMSKDPKDKDSKEVKSETNRARIFSLNDVRYGRTVEKQPGHTRSKHALFQTLEKKRNGTPDEEKLISDKTRSKWRCEWENFKYLWKIGNSRMITKKFHKDLELYSCKVEDEDTEKPDTEAHDTEVVNTEAQDTKVANTEVVNTEAHDTEAQDTEVVNTEAQDTVNTEAQDTEVVNTEAHDTEVVNIEAQDTKVFNPGALYNEALKCNPFNTTCIVEVLKSNGINLFFDRPLAEVYEDFVRMQEKPEEPKHEVPFPEPIGTFDNPGHGPMEVAYNVQESIVEQIARNNSMDSQASVARDRDLDTQGFLSVFARPKTSQLEKRNLTTFIRSYNVDKTPSFEVVEYDDRGYELRVKSSNDQQGVFWLQIAVTDNTGKIEQCCMTWKSVPATGNSLHRQECIQCSVRDPKGQETVLLGDEGAKLYYRFKTSNAWATNVGYSYSVDKIF